MDKPSRNRKSNYGINTSNRISNMSAMFDYIIDADEKEHLNDKWHTFDQYCFLLSRTKTTTQKYRSCNNIKELTYDIFCTRQIMGKCDEEYPSGCFISYAAPFHLVNYISCLSAGWGCTIQKQDSWPIHNHKHPTLGFSIIMVENFG